MTQEELTSLRPDDMVKRAPCGRVCRILKIEPSKILIKDLGCAVWVNRTTLVKKWMKAGGA